jgi:hypothetical protein
MLQINAENKLVQVKLDEGGEAWIPIDRVRVVR